MALIDALEKTITALAQKATSGMQSILSKELFKPVDTSGIFSKCGLTIVRKSDTQIEVSTNFHDYAYYTKYGRGSGKMPPAKPIEDWVAKHNIDKAAVFPIRKKIANEGTKRHIENNPLEFDMPLKRMIEMIKKTVGIDAVHFIESDVYDEVKALKDISFKL